MLPRSDEPLRLRVLIDRPPRPEGEYVLYWMTAQRRLEWNHALDRAISWASELRRPLLVLEPLRAGYRWASDRMHAFVLQGMAVNARRAADAAVTYHPWVESEAGGGRGLLEALARRAAVVVTDEFPCFFIPSMLAAVARRLDARLEAVDSNGLLPLRAAGKAHPTAYAFRRFLQGNLKAHLMRPPEADPLASAQLPRLASLPPELGERWPAASPRLLAAEPSALAALPIDHGVPTVSGQEGGAEAARRRLGEFLDRRLARYTDERSHPDADAASGLSPWLHFGHLSPHEILAALAERERWSPETLPARGNGGREGWWGMSRPAEAFLDELVTWRELGFNTCLHRPGDYDRYESLPGWARASLEKHAADPRPWRYGLDELAAAATHDELWNAAQRQLRSEGVVQNYLRMLWGKKVLEWSESPQEAIAALVELNNRWALDGRDPNSYSGIFWCLGRYDRPWAPERPIFGVVRYMSSDNTRRKLHLKQYLGRFGAEPPLS